MVIHENFPICIGKKIAFAVYRNAELLERIDRIKKLVDDIEAASKLLAKEIVMKYGDESPTYRTDLTQQFYTKTKKLWLDLANAYQGLSKQHVNWALLFRPPRSKDLWAFDDEWSLEIELVYARGEFAAQKEAYWISAFYSFNDRQGMDLTADILAQFYRRRDDPEKAILKQTMKSVFKIAAADSKEQQRVFRKGTELGRLKAAVAISTWVIYAWSTSWVDQICSCGLRYAVLADDERVPVFRQVACHED